MLGIKDAKFLFQFEFGVYEEIAILQLLLC